MNAVGSRPAPLSVAARERNIEHLRQGSFDLLIIGGGINGAGVARDAAMRGLRVALVEKGDFASGTSSKSSKLIHGGVRYLQQGDIRLVRMACRERDLLRRRLAPHLVQPLAFLFPVYRGDPVGFFTLGVGMWLYDLLAAFRNIRRHRMLSAQRTGAFEPGLRTQRLRGAALYYDCFTDDARLALETVLAAQEEGAVIVNYVELREFIKKDGQIVGAVLRDRVVGTELRVRCHSVVNTTGPWADQVRRLDDPVAKPCLRVTKGVHILVPRERIGNTHAVVMHSPRDRRVLFTIPWAAHNIIGTTDTDFHGSPDEVRADTADVEYLLEAANWYFPDARLRPEDVISSYAGLRPLVASEVDKGPSAVSREEQIFESSSGLITLGGGKLTTYRLVAKQIVDLVIKRLRAGRGSPQPRRKPCATSRKPLPGGRRPDPDEMARALTSSDGVGLADEQIRHLVSRYGSRAPEVIALIQNDADLKDMLVAKLPDIWAEAAYAVRTEMAVRSEDVLLRRTHVALKEPQEAARLADKISEKLKLSE